MRIKKEDESLVFQGKNEDQLIRVLKKCLVFGVKVLAVMMVFIVYLAIADVFFDLYQMTNEGAVSFFNVENLMDNLGAFLAVLVAIEIFLNIAFYLKEDAVHVPLVLSTALTAVARKVIIMDYQTADPHHIYATATIIFSVGITYWLVTSNFFKSGNV